MEIKRLGLRVGRIYCANDFNFKFGSWKQNNERKR